MKRVMVIGGGPAGLSATKELSSLGMEVVLVEKDPQLGGTPKKLHYSLLFPELRPASQVIDPLVKATENGNVKVHLNSIVEQAIQTGNGFELKVSDRKGNSQVEKVDAVIAASGFEHFDSRRKYEYGYGIIPNIYQISDIEKMLSGQASDLHR